MNLEVLVLVMMMGSEGVGAKWLSQGEASYRDKVDHLRGGTFLPRYRFAAIVNDKRPWALEKLADQPFVELDCERIQELVAPATVSYSPICPVEGTGALEARCFLVRTVRARPDGLSILESSEGSLWAISSGQGTRGPLSAEPYALVHSEVPTRLFLEIVREF